MAAGRRLAAAGEAWAFSLYSRHATGVELLFFREAAPEAPLAAVSLDPLRTAPAMSGTSSCRPPGSTAPRSTATGSRGRGTRRRATGSTARRCCSIRTPRPSGSRRGSAGRPPPARAHVGRAPLACCRGRRSLRPGADEPRPRAHPRRDRLRTAREGLHGAARTPGCAPARRGTFAGLIEKIPYLRNWASRSVELLPVHQFDPQEGNYWGYMTLQLLRAAPSVCGGGDAFGRVPRDGAGLPRGGHRGLAGRRLQPHQRRRRDRPDLQLPRASTTAATTCCADRRARTSTTPAAATRCARATRPRASWSLDSLRYWARRLRRRRLPLRPGLDPHPRRRRHDRLRRPGAHRRDRASSARDRDVRLVAEAWDIGSYQLGRGFPGITWRSGTASSATTCAASCRATRARSAR